jgi:hypothetical protein
MRPIPIALAATAALTLAACQRGSGDGDASQRAVEQAGGSVPTMQRTPSDAPTTGAAGATTSATDPNPAGAKPGDPSGAMGSTSPQPQPPVTTLPDPPK